MADYDSSMIKPVDGMQNIPGLNPVKQREQRKRRQQLSEENKEKNESGEGEQSGSVDEQDLGPLPEKRAEKENGRNPDSVRIDYCA